MRKTELLANAHARRCGYTRVLVLYYYLCILSSPYIIANSLCCTYRGLHEAFYLCSHPAHELSNLTSLTSVYTHSGPLEILRLDGFYILKHPRFSNQSA